MVSLADGGGGTPAAPRAPCWLLGGPEIGGPDGVTPGMIRVPPAATGPAGRPGPTGDPGGTMGEIGGGIGYCRETGDPGGPSGPAETGDTGATGEPGPVGAARLAMPDALVLPPASWAAVRRATWASAAALGQRAAGSLAIARSTTCRTTGGMSAGNGGGASRTWRIAISSGLSPSNGRCPDRHW